MFVYGNISLISYYTEKCSRQTL